MLVSFRVMIFCVSFVDRALDGRGEASGNVEKGESFRDIDTQRGYFFLRRGRKLLHSP